MSLAKLVEKSLLFFKILGNKLKRFVFNGLDTMQTADVEWIEEA